MTIPTEPIGSIPRPESLMEARKAYDAGYLSADKYQAMCDEWIEDTIRRFEETGSPVITDGEQTKPSFLTYPIHGLENLAPDGPEITFADGHRRQLPRIAYGPFRYAAYADTYLEKALEFARRPVKQAVISASALSLIYPEKELPEYSRQQFLAELITEAATDIRRCLDKGAHAVQIDFTEGRLAVKLDPTGGLLKEFVRINNQVLAQFSVEERQKIGIHTCPGGDQDSTHSADVDYAALLPDLFQLQAGSFYMQLASEKDRRRVLEIVRRHAAPEQRIFVGVVDPIDPEIETPEKVADRILEAAEILGPAMLGTTDDCGFSPFGDDISTDREIAFAKIRARVEGTRLASEKLGI